MHWQQRKPEVWVTGFKGARIRGVLMQPSAIWAPFPHAPPSSFRCMIMVASPAMEPRNFTTWQHAPGSWDVSFSAPRRSRRGYEWGSKSVASWPFCHVQAAKCALHTSSYPHMPSWRLREDFFRGRSIAFHSTRSLYCSVVCSSGPPPPTPLHTSCAPSDYNFAGLNVIAPDCCILFIPRRPCCLVAPLVHCIHVAICADNALILTSCTVMLIIPQHGPEPGPAPDALPCLSHILPIPKLLLAVGQEQDEAGASLQRWCQSTAWPR